jgi:hypothetical protein
MTLLYFLASRHRSGREWEATGTGGYFGSPAECLAVYGLAVAPSDPDWPGTSTGEAYRVARAKKRLKGKRLPLLVDRDENGTAIYLVGQNLDLDWRPDWDTSSMRGQRPFGGNRLGCEDDP